MKTEAQEVKEALDTVKMEAQSAKEALDATKAKAQECIHKSKEFMTKGGIHQLTDLRERIDILRIGFVEINIINVYSLVSIRFLD